MAYKTTTLSRAGWALLEVLLVVWIIVPVAASAPPPQRPPVTPGPRPPVVKGASEAHDDDDRDELVGAHIELQVSSAPPGAWTVVQWQDYAGDWHAVEGWRGTLEAGERKRWWVAHKDFGTGPFRWALYGSQGGQLLGTSDPFYLPDAANEMMSVVISLGDRSGLIVNLFNDRPMPLATPPVSTLMPTTGTLPPNAWPSVLFVLGVVLGGGLLLNHSRKSR
jgi:hypothetical protein